MDSLVKTLVERNFGFSHGELSVAGVSVGALAKKYGTPAFIYSSKVLGEKLDALRRALPPQFSVSYSVKANPNQAVLRYFLSRGCGLEVASAGELAKAIEAGCPPDRILFAGPGKTEAELEFALSRGSVEIHLESLTEAKRIAEISRRLGVRANVAIRVNPAGDAEGGAMRMGGRPAPFGVDEEALDEVLDVLLADRSLEFRGIHLFTGTQILGSSVLVSQYRHGIGIARRVVQRVGHPLHTVDFGGGLGIPYFPHESELDLAALQSGLAELFAGLQADTAFAGTRFLVEPGRFLVGEAGIYITRVNDIKVSRGKKFLILDGGMHHHLAASGNLGQTSSASPLSFLSHPAPPEIWVDGEDHLLCAPDMQGHCRLPEEKLAHLGRNVD